MATLESHRKSRAPRLILAFAAALMTVALAYPAVVGWQFASVLIAPSPFDHPDDPKKYGLGVQKVEIKSPRVTAPLSGWLFENAKAQGRAVLFLHGWRSHKQHMLKDYLRWLSARYTVLAFDHPGHGESPAGMTTLGDREREDAAAALALLRERGHSRIGVFGASMGGTTAIGLAAQDAGIKAVVSDATFARPQNITLGYYRDHNFYFPEVLAQSTLLAMNLRTGRNLEESAAERMIAQIAPRPVFLIHGTADTVITPDNGDLLLAAAKEPKALWKVEGADHLSEAEKSPYATQPAEYEQRVTSFFDKHL